MNVSDLSTFVQITASGSLSGAARLQGVSTVAISRSLASLEKDLAVRLFHRTTRSLSLTSEGETFLPYAQAIVDTKEAAEAALRPAPGATGTLKITAPVVFGQTIIDPMIPELLQQHPTLKVDLMFTDNIVDIVGHGFDLAVRIAPIKSSGLIAKKLADNPRILCASPDYLMKHGTPLTIDDLQKHDCLVLHGMEQWPFLISGQPNPVRMNARIYTSSLDSIRKAAINGVGLALMTFWDVKQQLQDGSLIEVKLEDASFDKSAIWAVYPTRHFVPGRVRVFLDNLRRAIQV